MGPCTFLVTAVVTAKPGENVSVMGKAAEVWKTKGLLGFYPGGLALCFRQASCRPTCWRGVRGRFEMRGYLCVGRVVLRRGPMHCEKDCYIPSWQRPPPETAAAAAALLYSHSAFADRVSRLLR